MFHNSRKTIGVFSDYGNYGQNHRYFIGDQTLWELPPYE